MPTREQNRADFALRMVDSCRGLPAAPKYKTQLVKLPARLHTNGLGQTVAFYLASGPTKPETIICGWIQDWLQFTGNCPKGASLLQSITKAEAVDYRRASAETRALAGWLKRFAEAFLGEGEG